MARRIHIGNVRILDPTDPYHKEGIILIKDKEYYYSRFRNMICLDNGIQINNKGQALEDYSFLQEHNQSTENILYMEENLKSYVVSEKEFKEKIKIMKKNKKENEKNRYK